VASSETNETLRWHDPEWLAGAVQWIDERVERVGEVDQFHAYPWATAIRVPTPEGQVWFKACIDELAHEVGTLELIAAHRPDLVPRLLAGDRERGWMLLDDAGRRMRDLEPGGGQLERWEEAISLYAQLQLDVAVDADRFAAVGVPDRRGRVTEQFAEILEDERATHPLPESALSATELEGLGAILPALARDEAELDSLGLPYTVQHDDLHDANIFVRDGEYRIIDWGDSCVASPLLSLTVALAVVAYRFGEKPDAPEVERVRAAYLEPFTALATSGELRRGAELARRVGYACGTIKWYEVMIAIERECRREFDVELPARLRKVLELCA
jgi:hypothetical protein